MGVWDLEQINHFLKESKKIKNATRFQISFLIAIFTGMRLGEILGLRWKDIDMTNNLIYVKQTLTETRELKYGAKNRSVVYELFIFQISC